MSEIAGELADLPIPPEPFVATLVVSTVARVRIDREPIRRRCSTCDRRRELYRVYVNAGGAADETDARCAECWGIR